jgi:hypothetical protein
MWITHKREYYFEYNKEFNESSMVFDKTSFLMISRAWAVREREKLYLIHLKYRIP